MVMDRSAVGPYEIWEVQWPKSIYIAGGRYVANGKLAPIAVSDMAPCRNKNYHGGNINTGGSLS